MRKTPNALNTREQGKEAREGEVGKEAGMDEGRTVEEGGREEGRDRKGGERKGGR